MISSTNRPLNSVYLNDRVSSISSISSLDFENGLIVRPKREIVFKYVSNNDITAEFEIINQSHNKRYLYRILSTSSKSYKVEPFKGEINSNEKIQVKSTLISKGVDIEKRMKDQFKIEFICLEDELADKNNAWNMYPKKEIRLSISIIFQKQNTTKSVSPARSLINGINYSEVQQSTMNKSQKSYQSPNMSQVIQNNSQLSNTNRGSQSTNQLQNSSAFKSNNPLYVNTNLMNNSNDQHQFDTKSPEESKATPDNFSNEVLKPLKLPNTYALSSSEKQITSASQTVEENQKYQQKYFMLRKRQEEQVELIKTYKEDIKKFHNDISKLKFIFRKNENKIENSSESKTKFQLQPYQLSILIFAFLLIGALIKM